MQLEIIQPDTSKKKAIINCICCKLMNYSHPEYSMFKGLGKLVYFRIKSGKIKEGPFCHYCITGAVLDKFPKGTKEAEVTIIDGQLVTQRKMYERDRDAR